MPGEQPQGLAQPGHLASRHRDGVLAAAFEHHMGLAAFTLNLDFEAIREGVAQRMPQEMEWRAAFGLTASLIWLYVEILRLLAIFNSND